MTKISIIIPVYNNLDLTIQCINSIKKYCQKGFYEIIISDDCSTDETKDFFKIQNDIIYIRNKQNMGFAYTCNRGAEISKGEYLLFLNNDTMLIDNILTKFLDTLKNFSNVGAVGGKLLYDDNTIQHAGVIVYPDKKVGHLFKNFPADYPGANKFRELQCITGACLAIKKELFFNINKFDENFINGFEDIDLCFRLRNFGYKVVYNPEISLFHFEEKTRKNLKKFDDSRNSLLITSKWLSKVSSDLFLIKEGYDFKLNDIGEFYIVKNNFENIKDLDLFNAIEKEPLYFLGYKKLIGQLLDNEKFTDAEMICKKLINFEPIIENFEILKSIFMLKGEKDKVSYIGELISNYKTQKLELKPIIEKIYQKLISIKNFKIAKYYKEWLDNILE